MKFLLNGLKWFKYKIADSNLKLFHLLPGPTNLDDVKSLPIIVKFIYFHHKNIASGRKGHLKIRVHQLNAKMLWVEERFTKYKHTIQLLSDWWNFFVLYVKILNTGLFSSPPPPTFQNTEFYVYFTCYYG